MAEGVSAQNETVPRDALHRRLLHIGTRLVSSSTVRLHTFNATMGVAVALLTLMPVVAAQALLPQLGGAPAVWSVTLAFTFVSILAGCGYAYALHRHVPPVYGIPLHCGLSLLAAITSANLTHVTVQASVGSAYLWLLGTLFGTIGLPLLVFSATIALLPRWLAMDGIERPLDVLRLRSIAGRAALVALVLFAAVFDGRLGLSGQAATLKFGARLFAILVASAAGMAWLDRQASARVDAARDVASGYDFADVISWPTRCLWVLMAGMPAALLVSMSAWMTVGFVAAPLVWVPLLLLYGLSLQMGWRVSSSRRGWLPAAMFLLILLQLPVLPFAGRAWLAALTFFMASVSCHRHLYSLRPAARHGPAFALWIAFGMAVGSGFAAFVAPHVFTGSFELTALFVVALFCLPGVLIDSREPVNGLRVVGTGLLLIALLMLETDATHAWGLRGQHGILGAIAVSSGLSLLLTREWVTQRIVLMLGLLAIGLAWPDNKTLLRAERSFFGSVQVFDHVGREADVASAVLGRAMDTVRMGKGAQRVVAAESPDIAQLPVVPAPILVGVVGVGTGAIGCAAKSGDAVRFFEVNPRAVQVARHAYPFLSRCTPQAPVIAGDVRLSLVREPDEAFDFLVVDLTMAEALPAHLLTLEALRLYMSRVSDLGILALRFNNRSLDLIAPITGAIDATAGVQAAVVRMPLTRSGQSDASLIFVARNPHALDGVLKWPDAEGLPRNRPVPWTDDRPGIAQSMQRTLLK